MGSREAWNPNQIVRQAGRYASQTTSNIVSRFAWGHMCATVKVSVQYLVGMLNTRKDKYYSTYSSLLKTTKTLAPGRNATDTRLRGP
jgi:hypothetical protein